MTPIRAASIAAVLAVALAACVLSGATGTKGTMPPPGANGEIDPSAVPEFIGVAGADGIAGYVAKEAVLDPAIALGPSMAATSGPWSDI